MAECWEELQKFSHCLYHYAFHIPRCKKNLLTYGWKYEIWETCDNNPMFITEDLYDMYFQKNLCKQTLVQCFLGMTLFQGVCNTEILEIFENPKNSFINATFFTQINLQTIPHNVMTICQMNKTSQKFQ